MKVTVLGSQGAIPKVGLFSSSLVLNISSTNILIDCCEGAQFQLRKNKIKLSKIEIILISHAHGDHYFGLIGLISTMSLMKRDKKLTLFCPLSVLKIVQAHLKYSNMNLSYELEMKVLNNQSKIKILDKNQFSIYAFPLKHSVYTNGFLIREKEKKRKLILEKALENNIDKISKATIKLLEKNNVIPDYEIISINSNTTNNPKQSIENARNIARNSGKKGVLVLSGKQCSLGVSIDNCDIVLLLNNNNRKIKKINLYIFPSFIFFFKCIGIALGAICIS